MLLDPGMNLTLRPMKYPDFYDQYRDAIKNTWTRRGGRPRVRPRPTCRVHAPGAAPHPPPRGLLRHRRHHRREQPGAQPLPAHQLPRGAPVPVAAALRGGRARPVLPDAARHLPARPGGARQGLRRGQQHPLDQAQGRLLLQVDRLGLRHAGAQDRRGPPHVPAQPHLLRRVHRGPVLLRRLRLRVLAAQPGPARRARHRHQLGVPRRVLPHELRVQRGRHRAPGGARAVRRPDAPRGRRR